MGAGAFEDGRLDLDACVLAPLLRPAGPDHVAFVHTAYQELLAARFLAEAANRDLAADLPGGAFLTEQVRIFLAGMPGRPETTACCPPGRTWWVRPNGC
ncbi:hypothetical protein [Streptomyces sp. NPDC093568]|uniref:hypothetical protein n=1 Tax=Streptomyces sp. NPDC093568 TaxID=3366041 RepID=UPI00381137E9